ncbi:MAG: dTMP kinase [Acidobacteriota bacterium]
MFLTLEGIEGSGKTTQATLLAGALRRGGREVLLTREPGGSPLGAPLRHVLLSGEFSPSPRCELLLYGADRAEHVARVIRPALARGAWVLCDRYGDATRAYQAFGRGLPRDVVEAVHLAATEGLEPDLTLYLRLSPEEGLSRARARNGAGPCREGRFEEESMEFHRRVARGYEALAAEFSGRIHPVDASGEVETVHRRILSLLEDRGVL